MWENQTTVCFFCKKSVQNSHKLVKGARCCFLLVMLYKNTTKRWEGIIFEKSKASALTNEAFSNYIENNGIKEFYITGADATGCVKSTSYDLRKLPEMYEYYTEKGCDVLTFAECK